MTTCGSPYMKFVFPLKDLAKKYKILVYAKRKSVFFSVRKKCAKDLKNRGRGDIVQETQKGTLSRREGLRGSALIPGTPDRSHRSGGRCSEQRHSPAPPPKKQLALKRVIELHCSRQVAPHHNGTVLKKVTARSFLSHLSR